MNRRVSPRKGNTGCPQMLSNPLHSLQVLQVLRVLVRDSVKEEGMYTQLLAAIRGLTDRVNSFETHPRQAEAVGSVEASPGYLPSFQEQSVIQEQRH